MKIDITSLIGNYNSTYIGYSSDNKVRINGSSGGIVTSLLLFALQKKLIDGAVVVRMDSNNPLKPEIFIAHSAAEICSAQGSKYIPVSLIEIIKAIENEEGRFAVVGVPCHIKGLRMIMESREDIKQKIVFTIGLICGRTVSPEGTDALIKKLNIDESKIKEIHYRKGEWPGFFRITQKDNTINSIPYKAYWQNFYNSYFYTPESCLYCTDTINELADISCGDAWLPDIKKHDKLGTSIIISRTNIGEKILKNALSEGIIELQEIIPAEVVRSQWTSLYFKKLGGYNRFKLKQFGSINGIFRILQEDGLWGLNAALFPILSKKINSRKFLKNKIMHMLIIFYKLYGISSNVIGFLWYKKWKRKYELENKITKIYIIGASHSYNKGWVAIVKCIISELKMQIPNVKFYIESSAKDYDKETYPNIEIIPIFSLKKFLKYNESDIIVHTGGDIFCISLAAKFFISLPALLGVFSTMISFLFWSILKKKVIIYAHSLGPYKLPLHIFLARFILKRSSLITVRGALSAKNLREIGITNFHETADPAFLLNGIDKKSVETIFQGEKINLPNDRPTIGVSISRSLTLCQGNDKLSFQIFTEAIEKIISMLDANILLIPHSIGRIQAEDDRIINEKFTACIQPKYKSHIYQLKNDYSPEELKGIIATCDIFIGYRMHANIAALSSGIPTLAISHGHKYSEIMQMFEMEKFVLYANNITSDELYNTALKLWNNRYDIRLQLKNKLHNVQKLAKLNAELAKKMITTGK